METKTLALLAAESAIIEQEIIESGGEITPEIEARLTITAETIAAKVDSCAFVSDKLKANAAFYKAKADDLYRVAKTFDNAEESLKRYIKSAMQTMGVAEIKGEGTRFVLTKSKPKLILTDELPAEYKMQITELVPDKQRIQDDLAVGIAIPGAVLEESTALRKYVNKKDLT